MERVEIGFHPLTPKVLSRLPKKATEAAAGWDVQALLEEDLRLKPGQRALVSTGFAMSLPAGYEAQLRPRSGWAYRTGVTLLNTPGTIDADYRGEVKILLINLGEEPVWIRDGDRIAQLIIGRIFPVEFIVKEEMTDTPRGNGGFGHSGR
jgi:dUTP pyrophosphatase